MFPILITIVIVFFSLTVTTDIEAQALGQVNVNLNISETEVTVGDPIILRLGVAYPSSSQVILPVLPTKWDKFEVQSQSPVVISNMDDGTELITQVIQIVAFAPGDYITPDFSVTIRDNSGDITEVQVPNSLVKVSSVLIGDDLNLREIKQQADLSISPLWPWVGGLVILVLVIVACCVYYVLSHRKDDVLDKKPSFDTRTPYEMAWDDLNKIAAMDLPSQNQQKNHYTLVSNCLREYIGRDIGFPAIDLTTAEIRMHLRQTDLESSLSRKIVTLLEDCDLVKFAKYIPEIQESYEITCRTRRILTLIEGTIENHITKATTDDIDRPRIVGNTL